MVLTPEWSIERNIIAFNFPEGLSCRDSDLTGVRDNLFFQNGDYDFGCQGGTCTLALSNAVADPQFCDPDGGDYRVSGGSPALSGGFVIGAFPDPGCQ
jgi:hypothetical protein